MKKIAAIVQARMTSTRLPNKVLLDLLGKPLIGQVFNQLSYSKKLNQVLLATSSANSDDLLEKWALNNNIQYYRGDLNNVLKRFYDTATSFEADVIVRITADCPLIDPTIMDNVIDDFLSGDFDYYSNINPPTFPDGLDTEVFSYSTLEAAYENAELKSEIEHVTPYIRNHPEKFKIGNLESPRNYEHLRWTVDNTEDYEFVKNIYQTLYKENSFIKWQDVLGYLNENEELTKIKSHIVRNEGFIKSLKEDQKI